MKVKIKCIILFLIIGWLVGCQPNCFAEQTQKEGFYGKWVIKTCIAGGKRGTSYNDIKIRSRLGKEISYYKDKAIFNGKICINPIYKQQILSENEFFDNYGYVSFSEINYKGKNITGITVYEKPDDEWYSFGSEIFIVDKEHLILHDDTVFFLLIRAK